MDETTAIVFQTHFFDRWCLRAFRRIAGRAPPHHRPVVALHLAPGAPVPPLVARVPHHIVRTDALRTPDYPGKSSGERWSLWHDGHTDLIAMSFWRAHPTHARYWFVEYDVRFSGDWRRFFAAYEDDSTDLLAPQLLTRSTDPGWYNWPSLAGPRALPPPELQVRGFLPVFRASAAMMRHMDARYREGWTGHLEATWPTLALDGGLSVADLGGHGPFTPPRYHGLHYTATPLAEFLAPGTLIFKPALHRTGSRPDMLWHPVKPFVCRAEIEEGVRDIVRRCGVLARGATALAGLPLPSWMRPGRLEEALAARRDRRAGTRRT